LINCCKEVGAKVWDFVLIPPVDWDDPWLAYLLDELISLYPTVFGRAIFIFGMSFCRSLTADLLWLLSWLVVLLSLYLGYEIPLRVLVTLDLAVSSTL